MSVLSLFTLPGAIADIRVETAVSVAWTASSSMEGEQDLTEVMENPIEL
jgi:hypothetical protein